MTKLTPMMAQYRAIKENHQDCILMYRLGDFYEMFFEDAVEASKILQITLTTRGKGGANSTPMCGVPFHAIDQYLAKLTRAGKKVAMCDQTTAPTGKGIVEREVVRIITPGTTFDDSLLDNKSNNYVACMTYSKSVFGFAYADITTGDFKVTQLDSLKAFESELVRINPAELIASSDLLENPNIKAVIERNKTFAFDFDYTKDSKAYLMDSFEIKSLEAFGLDENPLATCASGMLYDYLKETQKTELNHIGGISFYALTDFMPLDQTCIRNLELFYTSRGQKDGSLISVIDNTSTSMGGRMLRSYLLHPLLNKSEIDNRLDSVEIIKNNSSLLRDIREKLSGLYDIERLLSRLSIGSGNARDLLAMKLSLMKVPEIKLLINEIPELSEIDLNLNPLTGVVEAIENGICDEPPVIMRDGGMIRDGYNAELDDLRSISTEGKNFIVDLQERESKRSGISTLKVKFNKVFGYYIEVSKANIDSVPEDYIRKQTLVNAERYITPELKEYEEKVLNAEGRIKELEYELFYAVRMEVLKEIVNIQKTAKAFAELDVYATFAFNAEKFNYCKPNVTDNGEFNISGGRHPVIERINFADGFIPNDCFLDEGRNFMLITGPNMGGKSTYLRQVALITLMAQIGSYVPAESAKLSIVDRIFTRVGASDNLVRGQSTFMVEMQEAAYIINHATSKSLIILDEVGRGTSTYDGVSIAWSIVEYIHDKLKAKTLFATHYHELIELIDGLDRAVNMSVYVRESEKDGVVFLYKIVEGGVDKSYGIEVAKLAGLPTEVVARSRGVLMELEERHIQKVADTDQMDLFTQPLDQPREHSAISENHKNLLNELQEMDVNKMTPLEALQKLDDINKRSKKD